MEGELREQVVRAAGDAKTRLVKLEETVYKELQPGQKALDEKYGQKTKILEEGLETARRDAAAYKGELDELKTQYKAEVSKLSGALDAQGKRNDELEAGLKAVREALAGGANVWLGSKKPEDK